MGQSSSRTAKLQALEEPAVLSLVLQFAGQRQWLLASSVSRAWAAVHEVLASQPRQTSYAQVVASLARVHFAWSCDSRLVDEDQHLRGLSKAAAFSGNGEILTRAKAQAGYRWSRWLDDLCMAAAVGRQLATFQWLRIPAGPVLFDGSDRKCTLAERAASAADLATLQWLLQTGLSDHQWSDYHLVTVAAGAAGAAALDILNWLRAQPALQLRAGMTQRSTAARS
jgi:hypothetical protein